MAFILPSHGNDLLLPKLTSLPLLTLLHLKVPWMNVQIDVRGLWYIQIHAHTNAHILQKTFVCEDVIYWNESVKWSKDTFCVCVCLCMFVCLSVAYPFLLGLFWNMKGCTLTVLTLFYLCVCMFLRWSWQETVYLSTFTRQTMMRWLQSSAPTNLSPITFFKVS